MANMDWDSINPNYIKDIFNRKVHNHPKSTLKIIIENINKSVFENGKSNVVHNQDMFA